MKSSLPRQLRLLAITDRHVTGAAAPIEAAADALAAGLPALMLREKDLPAAQIAPLARALRERCREHGALFILNRRIELAAELGADGVHLGREGPTLPEARAALGPGAVLGYSAHGAAEALQAFERGADYVTFSPVFPMPGKGEAGEPAGLEGLRDLVRRAPGPVLALGGVTADRVESVARTGAAGIAAIRAIFAAPDPGPAVAGMLARWDRAREAIEASEPS